MEKLMRAIKWAGGITNSKRCVTRIGAACACVFDGDDKLVARCYAHTLQAEQSDDNADKHINSIALADTVGQRVVDCFGAELVVKITETRRT